MNKKILVNGTDFFTTTAGNRNKLPAVVLESGYGDDSGTWDPVVHSLSQLTKVFTYDRAGLGRSGPPPEGSRTSRDMVAELKELLEHSSVEPPFVLVGHSFGGVNAQLYAAAYPDDVCGLLLVDATPGDYRERFLPLMPEAFREAYHRQFTLEINDEEFGDSLRQLQGAALKQDLPITVLSAGKKDHYSQEAQALWHTMQKEMAGNSAASSFEIAENSGHYIHKDEPELVVRAVRKLVT
ncbi:alpha/beta fold hydrolase [Alteribacter natronophilus]|uniref:alpha/beta fold hydrolase n=1 Tax=Alteribacter natronophilus TaxID=2583810 RepID=UPI001486F832|nr:alpha/beta hydrolase [Alteribacter natronophilus]